MIHALDDAGIDALLTDDVASARTLLPGWRVHGNAPGSWLTLLRRTLDPFGSVPLPPPLREDHLHVRQHGQSQRCLPVE